VRVSVEAAYVRFAHHLARGALVREPRSPGAHSGRDRRNEKRFSAARLARMPQVNDARSGGIRALLLRLRLQLAQPFSERHATQILPVALAAHDSEGAAGPVGRQAAKSGTWAKNGREGLSAQLALKGSKQVFLWRSWEPTHECYDGSGKNKRPDHNDHQNWPALRGLLPASATIWAARRSASSISPRAAFTLLCSASNCFSASPEA
jgi:hypothetical protein